MQANQTPTLVPLPFAANGTKNTIPEASQIGITPGAASLNDGFPPLTFTPVAAGGVPPTGADFNGILNLITQTIRWKQAGVQFGYSSSFANDTNVGGYPKGAVLMKSTLNGLWISTADNNASNPDTGGANWADLTAGRLIGTQVFTGSGTYTPTPGMTFVIFEVQGGGASGGGATVPSAGSISVGSPGTAGAYARGKFTAAQVGASQAVTVGAGASGQTGGGGLNGGTSSVGTLISAVGGIGGTMLNNQAAPAVNGNGNFATTVTGANLFSSSGACASLSLGLSGSVGAGAPGGASPFGGGGYGVATNATGSTAINQGAGGGGVAATSSATGSLAGGAGRTGIVIAWEYS